MCGQIFFGGRGREKRRVLRFMKHFYYEARERREGEKGGEKGRGREWREGGGGNGCDMISVFLSLLA